MLQLGADDGGGHGVIVGVADHRARFVRREVGERGERSHHREADLAVRVAHMATEHLGGLGPSALAAHPREQLLAAPTQTEASVEPIVAHRDRGVAGSNQCLDRWTRGSRVVEPSDHQPEHLGVALTHGLERCVDHVAVGILEQLTQR